MGKDSPVKKDQYSLSTKFVYSWVCVIANIKREVGPNNTLVGKSRGALREELVHRCFKPTKVELLWDHTGHSGFGIVEFGKYLDGCKKAMDFEKKLSLQSHGRTEFLNGTSRDSNLYGWIATEEDYLVSGPVGKKQRNGAYDIKSVKQLLDDEERKLNQLVPNLPPSIDRKSYYEEEIAKIRTNKAKYESIIGSGEGRSGEIVRSSGDHSSEDDSDDDSDDSSDDEDATKKKKIKR